MMQLQSLVDCVDKREGLNRSPLFYCTPLPPRWTVEVCVCVCVYVREGGGCWIGKEYDHNPQYCISIKHAGLLSTVES